ncbi:MAG: hypothetical protein ABI743_02405, partial [bacterium]
RDEMTVSWNLNPPTGRDPQPLLSVMQFTRPGTANPETWLFQLNPTTLPAGGDIVFNTTLAHDGGKSRVFVPWRFGGRETLPNIALDLDPAVSTPFLLAPLSFRLYQLQ